MKKCKCPYCDETIEELKFESSVTQRGYEWGTCDLDGDNMSWDDSEFNDSETNETNYKCPLCDIDISLSQLKILEKESKKLNEDGKVIVNKPKPPAKIKFVIPGIEKKVESLICPKCGNINPIDAMEPGVICNKCGIDLIRDKVKTKTFGNLTNTQKSN